MTIDLKKAHPVIQWGLLIAAIGLGGKAMYAANNVENLALANEKDIFYEREIRVVSAVTLEKNLDELKEAVDKFKQELKSETGEIKALLNQILLQRVASPSD